MMTMNDQETISSRSSLDTDRIEEPHHDDDLDTSSSTSESTSIISNSLQQEVIHLCECILATYIFDYDLTWFGRKPEADAYRSFGRLVSRTSLFEHQPHHQKQQHDQ